MASKKPSGLGRGLGALLGDDVLKAESTGSLYLPISQVESCSSQPRKHFDEASLAELADSIREHGIIQPLTVRKLASGYYQIIAGERRWRAARLAGLQEVPVIVMEADDRKAAELAMIENLQREDLSPIEEAQGYQTLMEHYHFTQEEVSRSVGKSRPAITNAMRLLRLPEEIIHMVSGGKLSAGHARTLLAFESEDDQLQAAQLAVKQGLSVRELEKLAKKANAVLHGGDERAKRVKKRPVFIEEVELSLNEHLGRKVKIQEKGKEKGVLTIEFYSQEDLQNLARLLGGEE